MELLFLLCLQVFVKCKESHNQEDNSGNDEAAKHGGLEQSSRFLEGQVAVVGVSVAPIGFPCGMV